MAVGSFDSLVETCIDFYPLSVHPSSSGTVQYEIRALTGANNQRVSYVLLSALDCHRLPKSAVRPREILRYRRSSRGRRLRSCARRSKYGWGEWMCTYCAVGLCIQVQEGEVLVNKA